MPWRVRKPWPLGNPLMHDTHIRHDLGQILNLIHSLYQINPTLYYRSTVGRHMPFTAQPIPTLSISLHYKLSNVVIHKTFKLVNAHINQP